jgi:hypothetical protein
MTREAIPLYVPAIYMRDISGNYDDPRNHQFQGTLYFDERAMFAFEGFRRQTSPECSPRIDTTVVCRELPGQTQDQLHNAMRQAFDILARLSDLLDNRGAGLLFPSPAEAIFSIFEIARWHSENGRIMGDLILHRDLCDLPNAPIYVLADDEQFGDFRYRNVSLTRTLVVPCQDKAMANRALTQLRRYAVNYPYSWDEPGLSNLRTIHGPWLPAPLTLSTFYSLLSTAPLSWLWLERDEIAPPDKTLERSSLYLNERTIEIGELDVSDGELVLRDPRYGPDELPTVPISESIVRVLPGRYRTYARVANEMIIPDNVSTGLHVLGFQIRHADPEYAELIVDFDEACAEICVDSGQIVVTAGWNAFLSAEMAMESIRRHPLQIIQDVDVTPSADTTRQPRTIGYYIPTYRGGYDAWPARRSDGAIVAISVPLRLSAYAPDFRGRQPRATPITIPPYYETLLGQIDSYLETMKERKLAAHPAIVRFAKALHAAANHDRSLLDELVPQDLVDATSEAVPELRAGDPFARRGADLLERLIIELQHAPAPTDTSYSSIERPPLAAPVAPDDDEEIPW